MFNTINGQDDFLQHKRILTEHFYENLEWNYGHSWNDVYLTSHEILSETEQELHELLYVLSIAKYFMMNDLTEYCKKILKHYLRCAGYHIIVEVSTCDIDDDCGEGDCSVCEFGSCVCDSDLDSSVDLENIVHIGYIKSIDINKLFRYLGNKNYKNNIIVTKHNIVVSTEPCCYNINRSDSFPLMFFKNAHPNGHINIEYKSNNGALVYSIDVYIHEMPTVDYVQIDLRTIMSGCASNKSNHTSFKKICKRLKKYTDILYVDN